MDVLYFIRLQVYNSTFFVAVDFIMSARLSVTKPTLRKSTLALHRVKSKDHEGFEDVKQFVKQVSMSGLCAKKFREKLENLRSTNWSS
jgi:hypothetical protein